MFLLVLNINPAGLIHNSSGSIGTQTGQLLIQEVTETLCTSRVTTMGQKGASQYIASFESVKTLGGKI